MNAQQVEKHNKVIKWFCDNPDKGVWFDHVDGWKILYDPLWSLAATYIQNDEYAELRKAQADGKTIQCLVKWKEIFDGEDIKLVKSEPYDIKLCDITFAIIKPNMLRIKPDEPEFKKGDWVRYKNSVKKITDGTSPDGYCACNKDGYAYKASDLKLWQPQEGEWCVFYGANPTKTKYIVARFVKRKKGLYVAGYGGYSSSFTNIAPKAFVDTLEDS